jgi:crotonobetainyl-CoA:carnitine CoA-transferase CaiB-like acyl-CoA transferase
MLSGIRVVDATTGIAGGYATKVLADAGAAVTRLEPEAADPLRRSGSGALFEHLHLAKRPGRGDLDAEAADADVVVTSTPDDAARLCPARPGLVVTSVTPFGTDGPWRDRAATEFTLQAAAGSTGQRGLPDDVPLAAGGRIGEWIAGTYAALGTIAAIRRARRTGRGAHVDVAVLDAMAVTMVTYPSVFAEFAGWPPATGPARAVEVPSVEPTADGYAVFTTNSAAQFQDFLVMVGHPELLEDRELALQATRFARRGEFEAMVQAWTTERTTDEVLEEAGLFRIPAGPVLDGATITDFPHFREREVFSAAPSGRFVRPRPPFRIGPDADVPPRAPADAPAGPAARALVDADAARRADASPLPLDGVRVLDCTAWWAGPVAPHALAALGADVVKVEATGRPDLMRYSSTKPPTEDRWWEWGPIFHAANSNKRGVTLDLTTDRGRELFERLAATADVVVENYTPRVMDQFGLTWERLHEVNPELVYVRMPAFGLSGPWRDRTGFAQTMECVTGMAWLTGHADGPPVLVRGACDPVAGMHSVIATLLALEERDRTGKGQFVEVAMVEAALNVAAEQVIEHAATGEVQTRDGNRGPNAAPQGVYRADGDDAWVALAVATDDQWAGLVEALGSPGWATDPALATEAGRRAAHDHLDEQLTAWAVQRTPEAVVEALQGAGVPAEVVVAPRDICRNPQLRHRGLFEVEHHHLTGDHELPMLPFRLSGVDRWLRFPSPSLGQHNAELLGEVGVDAAELDELRAAGVVGDRPTGL